MADGTGYTSLSSFLANTASVVANAAGWMSNRRIFHNPRTPTRLSWRGTGVADGHGRLGKSKHAG
ncbi:hypothetical protein An08g04610 [Aspergillus niger]|uniref:Uncharacterized protein n=2 Tax=Aspergillus niger TaxID=5061 RepID=A2QR33_ASPNC|nr:hypothetical protein An08g04610 [Aspergillus niger]CAK45434.1 hypothetical protein An08g04610 [Aspergillus niger]